MLATPLKLGGGEDLTLSTFEEKRDFAVALLGETSLHLIEQFQQLPATDDGYLVRGAREARKRFLRLNQIIQDLKKL